MRYLTNILALFISITQSINLATAKGSNLDYNPITEYSTVESSDMACLDDITISKWDCMFALAGSRPCTNQYYEVFFSSTNSGPFTSIGVHDVTTFYFVELDGYYKLKASCNYNCYESNVLYFDHNCSPVCGFEIDAPFPEGSTINHCYTEDGKIKLNASTWYDGCGVATYKWVTPTGNVSGPMLNGFHGYGTYLLTITCHDASCYYEEESLWFKVKEHCYTSHCEFMIDQPYHTKEHCFEDDGDLWINGASWVSHCSNATYKWSTPIGDIHSPLLEGNYGYGTYTLRVICDSHDCHYAKKEVSFVLKKKCEEHCHFKLNSPLATTIKHCYDTEGIIWIDATSWVKGCHHVDYEWSTPHGKVTGAELDGKYGYGKFTLTVTCHDAACYYERRSTSFTLVDGCHHQKPYVIYCPDTKQVNCDAELWNLDHFGKPYYIHQNKKIWVYGEKVHRHMNDCNRGYITREWKVKDPNGYWHTCSQTIYVGEDAYGNAKIDWPKEHIEVEGCNPSIEPDDMPYGAKKPYYENSGCAKYGHSYSDQEFYYSGTCKKVVRKWTVIDWCVYDGNKDREKGKYVYYQTIKINNDDKPTIVLDDDITVSTSNCKQVQVDLDDLLIDASSCGDKFDISNNSPYADHNHANASGIYPVGVTDFHYTVAYGCGYKKKYKQRITVEDEGDLNIYCEGKLVMPLVGIDTDNDGINDRGEAEIWAKDFNLGSKDLCGGEIDFSFSADSLVMSRTFTCDEVGINEIEIYATDQRGNQTYCVVEMHIQNNGADIVDCVRAEEDTEEEEDNDSIDTEEQDADDTEEQEDNSEEEGSDEEDTTDDEEDEMEEEINDDEQVAKASGLIKTQYGSPIADVELELHMNVVEGNGEQTFDIVDIKIDSFVGGSGTLIYVMAKDTIYHNEGVTETMVIQATTNTNEEGEFTFTNMARHETYMIDPSPSIMDKAKLDLSDANRLYAHISGANPITDAYTLLAADVDRSGSVDVLDLDYLLSFINGETDDLSQVEMIFVDATYQFEDELNPWSEDYTTVRMIEASEVENHRADFIAITLGDIIDTDTDESFDTVVQRERRDSKQALVSPNPFYLSTTITINNELTQMGTLTLYTINGMKVYESNVRLAKGKEQIIITDQMISDSGIYIYSLELKDISYKGRLLKVR